MTVTITLEQIAKAREKYRELKAALSKAKDEYEDAQKKFQAIMETRDALRITVDDLRLKFQYEEEILCAMGRTWALNGDVEEAYTPNNPALEVAPSSYGSHFEDGKECWCGQTHPIPDISMEEILDSDVPFYTPFSDSDSDIPF